MPHSSLKAVLASILLGGGVRLNPPRRLCPPYLSEEAVPASLLLGGGARHTPPRRRRLFCVSSRVSKIDFKNKRFLLNPILMTSISYLPSHFCICMEKLSHQLKKSFVHIEIVESMTFLFFYFFFQTNYLERTLDRLS